MSKYEKLKARAAEINQELATLSVWLKNYYEGTKQVVKVNGLVKVAPDSERGRNFIPRIKIDNHDRDWFGEKFYEKHQFPELFDAVAEKLEERHHALEHELSEIRAKLDAIEELLQG